MIHKITGLGWAVGLVAEKPALLEDLGFRPSSAADSSLLEALGDGSSDWAAMTGLFACTQDTCTELSAPSFCPNRGCPRIWGRN